MGGAVRAVECGFVEEEKSRIPRTGSSRMWESGEQVIVGVNRFQIKEELPSGLLRVNPAVRDTQNETPGGRFAPQRDAAAVSRALETLKVTAEGTGNLMPPIIEAVRCMGSLGEICDVLRGVFGEYTHASHC